MARLSLVAVRPRRTMRDQFHSESSDSAVEEADYGGVMVVVVWSDGGCRFWSLAGFFGLGFWLLSGMWGIS